MTTAVLSALQTEIDLLVESLDVARRGEIAGWPVWSGSLHGEQVVLAKTGVGKVNAGALTALVWSVRRPVRFLFTGVAGGLDPTLEVGDLVIGERTIQHDAGVIGGGGKLERYQAGHLPFFNPTDEFGFAPSDDLLTEARSAAADVEMSPVLDRHPTVTFGTILTGDQFLNDSGMRDRLHKELNAQAIEMEGAAVAQVTNRLGADHLVIRSLSDLAGNEAVHDFERFVPEVAANSARLVLRLLDGLEKHGRDHPVGP